MVKSGKSNTRLRVRRVVDAPLHEVSGICLRRGRNGRMSLIAVGDRMSKIAWFSLPGSDDGRIDWHTSDIAKLSGSMLPQDDPQIEAVCADGLGRVLLLQETPPRVELIDPKALKVVAAFDEAPRASRPAAPAQPKHQIPISPALHTAGSFLGDFPTPDGVRNSSREQKGSLRAIRSESGRSWASETA